MTTEQAALYKALVNQVKKDLQEATGMNKRGLVLSSLTRIKQICNHPAHYLGDSSPVTIKGKHRSGKVKELMHIVDEATESGERLLVFTPNTRPLAISCSHTLAISSAGRYPSSTAG